MPDRLAGALKELVKKLEEGNRAARVEEIRYLQECHEFVKDNQNIFWSGQDKRWKPVTSPQGASTKADQSDELLRYDFKTNIYTPNALIDAAVMVQNPPEFEFEPKDATSQADVVTAREGRAVADFIADNNRLDARQVDVAWLGYLDAGCASYTRFVRDSEKYGTTQVPIMAPGIGKLTPDSLHCNCGAQQDLQEGWQQDISQIPENCPQCQAPIGPDNVQVGQTGMVPQQVGANEVPNGQEVIDYLSYLEVERPYWAKKREEFPWIKWETEVPRSKLKALYPGVAEKMAQEDGSQETTTIGGRNARLSLSGTATGRSVQGDQSGLITFKRVWLRSFAFYDLDDKALVQELLSAYPSGCFVALAGEIVCEARDESLDDHWRVWHSVPGDGQIRVAAGRLMVDVQRRLNTEENIQTETYERQISVRFMDPDVVDIDAYEEEGALPGLNFPATPKPGMAIGDGVYDTPQPEVSMQMIKHSEAMKQEDAQFITGNTPEVFGGDTGANDTAHGIQMIKDSAMGRKAMQKRLMNEFYAETMLVAVQCFQKNRQGEVAMRVKGLGDQFDSKIVNLDEIQGNIVVRTSADESYPTSIQQKRALLATLFESQNPEILQTLAAPENADVVERYIGAADLRLPGDSARRKQFREIRQMLQGIAVQVNPIMDTHDAEIAAIDIWWNSDEGEQARETNPQGVMLVQQHKMEHLNMKAQQAMAAAPPPGPGGPPQGAPPQ